jgi:hypothetical protein
MSSKNKKKAAVAAVKAPQASELDARERAENEGMPARPSGALAAAPPAGALEGEGSRTAAHHYEEGLRAAIAGGKSEALADEAAHALDGSEAAALREAEDAARLGLSAKAAKAHHP